MPEIIEWLDESGTQIVYRHPRDRLQWGDYLTVKQNQVAVFMKDGKAYDVLPPGSHVIKTSNIPVLTRVLSAIVGYDKNPFHAEVIFVSTSDFKGKFGGRSQTQELAPLQFYGDYIYSIADAQKFVYEIAGNRGIFSQGAFEDFFRSFFQQQVIATLSHFSIVNVMQESVDTSKKVKDQVGKELDAYGIDLNMINFSSIDTTPEYRDRLFWMRSGVDANKLATFSGMKDVAGAMPEGSGGGAGLGMSAFLMPQMLNQADKIKDNANQNPPETAAVIQCNQCDGSFSPAAKFCPKCGDPTDDELRGSGNKFCINCGTQVNASAKFCPSCGNKMN